VLSAFKVTFFYLKQIGNTKTNDNQQTLMHFLATTVERHYPDVVDFADELLHVEKATRGSYLQLLLNLLVCKSVFLVDAF